MIILIKRNEFELSNGHIFGWLQLCRKPANSSRIVLNMLQLHLTSVESILKSV